MNTLLLPLYSFFSCLLPLPVSYPYLKFTILGYLDYSVNPVLFWVEFFHTFPLPPPHARVVRKFCCQKVTIWSKGDLFSANMAFKPPPPFSTFFRKCWFGGYTPTPLWKISILFILFYLKASLRGVLESQVVVRGDAFLTEEMVQNPSLTIHLSDSFIHSNWITIFDISLGTVL